MGIPDGAFLASAISRCVGPKSKTNPVSSDPIPGLCCTKVDIKLAKVCAQW